MHTEVELRLERAINRLSELVSEIREERQAEALAAILVRSASHTRKLEKLATALSRLDAQVTGQAIA